MRTRLQAAAAVAVMLLTLVVLAQSAHAQEETTTTTTTIPAETPASHGDVDALRVELGAGLLFVVFGVGLLSGIKVVR